MLSGCCENTFYCTVSCVRPKPKSSRATAAQCLRFRSRIHRSAAGAECCRPLPTRHSSRQRRAANPNAMSTRSIQTRSLTAKYVWPKFAWFLALRCCKRWTCDGPSEQDPGKRVEPTSGRLARKVQRRFFGQMSGQGNFAIPTKAGLSAAFKD